MVRKRVRIPQLKSATILLDPLPKLVHKPIMLLHLIRLIQRVSKKKMEIKSHSSKRNLRMKRVHINRLMLTKLEQLRYLILTNTEIFDS